MQSRIECLIRLRGEQRGDAPAVQWGGSELSYTWLLEESARVGLGLRQLGVVPGERVVLGLRNSPELIAGMLGVFSAGCVLVPLNPGYTAREAAYVVGDSGARVVIADPAVRKAIDGHLPASVRWLTSDLPRASGTLEPASGSADEPAMIVYTSGTTGRPKGAILSHRAISTNLATVARAWRWTEGDRLLLTLPCFHLHGLALGILGSLLTGSTIILRSRFVAEEAVADSAAQRATLFFGVPTMYNRLVALPAGALDRCDLSSMRLWVSGSAPLTAATFERFRERFGHEILERFGMSEGLFMISAPYDGPRRAGSVGHPLPGIDVRIVDADALDGGSVRDVAPGEQGELLVRGPNLFSGYWNRAEETARAFVGGYFRTGDLAARDGDGTIRITGRISLDIIKTRGFKISAVEIENQLQAHHAVRDVAVIGVPDADQGERLVAVVVPSPGTNLTTEELRTYARQHLAPHKVPAEIRFVEEIPSSGPGKFSKRVLIEQIRRG
ncbi:MAG TPA: AMP-binding protein [Candidatus Binatia bacterium]|nr:AMP-binding protein [Candidatus Binatia bacterium]